MTAPSAFSDLAAMARFVDPAGLAIVFGGSFGIAAVGGPLADTAAALRALGHLRRPAVDAPALRSAVARLERIAARAGLLALEHEPVDDPITAAAVRLVVDGGKRVEIERLFDDARHARAREAQPPRRFWCTVADVAPATGMIGTIVGLISMFAAMDDPARVGPAMALALLTTLYGAVLANLVAGPIAARLIRMAEIEEEARAAVEPHVAALADIAPVRRRPAVAAA